MENGLSVEEIVKLADVVGVVFVAAMIQLKMAFEFTGSELYVTLGWQVQDAELDVQFVEIMSRKVVNV